MRMCVPRMPRAAGERSCDLSDFERMGQPGAKMIAFVKNEDLRLVREPAEGGGMDDAVAVAAEIAAGLRPRLRAQPPAAAAGIGGIGGTPDWRFDHHFDARPIDQGLWCT